MSGPASYARSLPRYATIITILAHSGGHRRGKLNSARLTADALAGAHTSASYTIRCGTRGAPCSTSCRRITFKETNGRLQVSSFEFRVRSLEFGVLVPDAVWTQAQ